MLRIMLHSCIMIRPTTLTGAVGEVDDRVQASDTQGDRGLDFVGNMKGTCQKLKTKSMTTMH